jgi:hypothetical protein
MWAKGALEDLVLPANVQNVSACVCSCVCVEEVRGGESKVGYMPESALFPHHAALTVHLLQLDFSLI